MSLFYSNFIHSVSFPNLFPIIIVLKKYIVICTMIFIPLIIIGCSSNTTIENTASSLDEPRLIINSLIKYMNSNLKYIPQDLYLDRNQPDNLGHLHRIEVSIEALLAEFDIISAYSVKYNFNVNDILNNELIIKINGTLSRLSNEYERTIEYMVNNNENMDLIKERINLPCEWARKTVVYNKRLFPVPSKLRSYNQ